MTFLNLDISQTSEFPSKLRYLYLSLLSLLLWLHRNCFDGTAFSLCPPVRQAIVVELNSCQLQQRQQQQ